MCFFSIHRFSHIILLSFFHSPKRNSFVCSVVSCKWIMSFGLLLWSWYLVALSNYASSVCVSVLTNAHITLEVCISQPFECSLFGRLFFPPIFNFTVLQWNEPTRHIRQTSIKSYTNFHRHANECTHINSGVFNMEVNAYTPLLTGIYSECDNILWFYRKWIMAKIGS